ncbi:hypothetical protein Y032_0335g2864 [Ancylostoma ceylanicum]|uniref:Uncharacterized protein n=1 Tax=Ancylostoma ceylanicum TaxID=53326 RepID=A0A016RZN2_9BILA|nr:hypothetical protein Y032_0335g2864 [Ancylostoma ceylanicum]
MHTSPRVSPPGRDKTRRMREITASAQIRGRVSPRKHSWRCAYEFSPTIPGWGYFLGGDGRGSGMTGERYAYGSRILSNESFCLYQNYVSTHGFRTALSL